MDIETVFAYSNRIGAIPLFGSMIGGLRTLISVIGMIAGAIFGLIQLAKDKEPTGDPFFIFRECAKHFGLGLAEIVPGLGTIVHFYLHSRREEFARNPWNKILTFSLPK